MQPLPRPLAVRKCSVEAGSCEPDRLLANESVTLTRGEDTAEYRIEQAGPDELGPR